MCLVVEERSWLVLREEGGVSCVCVFKWEAFMSHLAGVERTHAGVAAPSRGEKRRTHACVEMGDIYSFSRGKAKGGMYSSVWKGIRGPPQQREGGGAYAGVWL